MHYPIVLHTDDGREFGVTVPDLPGCFSAGTGIEDALRMAREAIEMHVEVMLEDGEPIPVAKPIAQHRANPDYADGIWAIIEVPLPTVAKT